MILQPDKIFLPSRRVDDQQKFLLADSIDDQVINNAATLVEQKRVLPHADTELVDVVCEHDVEPFAGACSFDYQLPHLLNVEDADVVSHSLMLLDYTPVLYTH